MANSVHPLMSVIKNLNLVVKNFDFSQIAKFMRMENNISKVNLIRKLFHEGNVKTANEIKKSLLAFTPSATFSSLRKSENIDKYSAVIILDIDKLSEKDVPLIKDKIISSQFTYASFISPSARGIKILVKTDAALINHKYAFLSVKKFYENILNVPVDNSGSDVSRLCFFSFDENIFINPDAKIFETKTNSLKLDVNNLVSAINARKFDITADYNDWIKIAFALVSGFGELGRQYFHDISKFYPKYNPVECDEKFSSCLKDGSRNITIASLFWIANNYGVSVENSVSPLGNPPGNITNDKKISKDKVEEFLTKNYLFRYNIVTSRCEYKPIDAPDFEPLSDFIVNSLYRELIAADMKCSIIALRNKLYSDFCCKYDPIEEYFKNLAL